MKSTGKGGYLSKDFIHGGSSSDTYPEHFAAKIWIHIIVMV